MSVTTEIEDHEDRLVLRQNAEKISVVPDPVTGDYCAIVEGETGFGQFWCRTEGGARRFALEWFDIIEDADYEEVDRTST